MKKTVKLLMILCLAAMMVLSGCGAKTEAQAAASAEESTQTGQLEAESEGMVIDTKYGSLYFPDQWEGMIVTEDKEEGEKLTITFETAINDKTYPLFDVVVGVEEERSVGILRDDSGKERRVGIELRDIEATSDLTDGEQRRLYAMQEDLNYLIDNLDN